MEAQGMVEIEGALKTADAWLERWAQHVGSCRGARFCECGLTRVQYEIKVALAAVDATQGEIEAREAAAFERGRDFEHEAQRS